MCGQRRRRDARLWHMPMQSIYFHLVAISKVLIAKLTLPTAWDMAALSHNSAQILQECSLGGSDPGHPMRVLSHSTEYQEEKFAG